MISGVSSLVSTANFIRWFSLTLLLIAVPSAMAVAADGSAAPHTGSSEGVFLCQIVLLIAFGRLLGEAMLRIGQPAVMGQLIAGMLLGPSVLGALWPDLQHAIFPPDREQKAMIDAVAQLGILMLLLLAGMETDISVVGKLRRTALSVSLAGIAIPFACGFTLGQMLPDTLLPNPEQRLITALFLGTALSISSVKIVATVVREMNFLRRTVGQLIVTSAVIDDTVCWVIIAVTFGLALHGRIELTSLTRSLLGIALFLVASFTVGRRLIFFLIRWANDHFVSEVPVITTILAVMGGMALITDAIGVQTVLGAFVAGILIGQSPILTRHIEDQLRGLITALFMPVFFGLAGLNADLRLLEAPSLLLLSLGFIAIASVGKFSGAFLGGALSGLTWAESFALGWGMNARGSTEIIVASLGLSMGALNESLFTIILAMAVVTTMAMPPILRWALARLPLRAEEKARLEREEFEARGFVTNIERLLVAVDESENGRFASRLAGLLAGSRRVPSTVLPLGAPGLVQSSNGRGAAIEAIVKEAAGAAQIESAKAYDAQVGIDVTTRVREQTAEEAVAEEARKGYDLLVIGIERTIAVDGGIDENVTSIAAAFDGPFAVAVARGQHQVGPAGGPPLKILVPVTGTRHSQRGAEVAMALARASLGSVTVLHVARRRRPSQRRGLYHLRAAWGGLLENEEAILQDAVRLGDQYGVPVQTAARTQGAAETAILSQLSSADYNLVIMGVSPRPGASVFLGDTATAILARSERSILFVAS
jgi:Kef-type K+ transport system membrane component KefB/nucleotide-binding universal stress UspA family protein